ncbi:MAG: hypothetical protein COA78_03800 [Blastopirellula sp.]|nr:MAG: hypothetical protein COA78_03800 [Blastopirellula sp.]
MKCLHLVPILFIVGILSGCGGSGKDEHPVRGRVHNGGEALTITSDIPGAAYVEISFYPLSDTGTADEARVMLATAEADGSFSVEGESGGGLAPGKYKVEIRQWDPYPDNDKLKGKFSLKNSKIEVTVPSDSYDYDVSAL